MTEQTQPKNPNEFLPNHRMTSVQRIKQSALNHYIIPDSLKPNEGGFYYFKLKYQESEADIVHKQIVELLANLVKISHCFARIYRNVVGKEITENIKLKKYSIIKMNGFTDPLFFPSEHSLKDIQMYPELVIVPSLDRKLSYPPCLRLFRDKDSMDMEDRGNIYMLDTQDHSIFIDSNYYRDREAVMDKFILLRLNPNAVTQL